MADENKCSICERSYLESDPELITFSCEHKMCRGCVQEELAKKGADAGEIRRYLGLAFQERRKCLPCIKEEVGRVKSLSEDEAIVLFAGYQFHTGTSNHVVGYELPGVPTQSHQLPVTRSPQRISWDNAAAVAGKEITDIGGEEAAGCCDENSGACKCVKGCTNVFNLCESMCSCYKTVTGEE